MDKDIDNIYTNARVAFDRIWNNLVSSEDTKKYIEAKKKWEASQCYNAYQELKKVCGDCADMDKVIKQYPADHQEYKKAIKVFKNSADYEEFLIRKKLIIKFIIKEAFYIPDSWCTNMMDIFGFDVND